MRTLDTHELAWAAGLFDGEGCIGAYTNGKGCTYLHVAMPQIDPQVLDRFRSIVGAGYVAGPYVSKLPNHSPQWRYQTSKFESVQNMVAVLWQWLSPVKRAQASKALLDMRAATKPALLRSRNASTGRFEVAT